MSAGAVVSREIEPRPWLLAFLWMTGLGLFFFSTYGLTNWVTGRRADVGQLAFEWERRLPFLAWTIVPYWTTDFFYAGALFLCATRDELSRLGKTLIATQVLCIAGFLLVPLQFSFERPHAPGLFGQLFDALMSFDKPFNQAPSLHVALTVVLWVAYSRHLEGWLLWLVRIWFVMMALSTLTTYQHHFIDVPTGFFVGLFTTALFMAPASEAPNKPAPDPNRFRLSAAYLAGALILITAAFLVGGAAWPLLWPGISLAIVGGIYWAGNPQLFRKAEGKMLPQMVILLAPYLAAAWLNSRWHTRSHAGAHEIAGAVWLGRIPRRVERAALGIASMVDVAAELPVDTNGVAYRGIPMLDLLAPTPDQLEAAQSAIAGFAQNRPTLVSCALGYSRSAASVAAWLIASGEAQSVDQAIEIIRARRPRVVLPAAHRASLAEWAARRNASPKSPRGSAAGGAA